MKTVWGGLKKFVIVLLMPIVFSFSGCIYLVVGGLGALGGYVVSPDTVEGLTSNDRKSVWETAKEIVTVMGTPIQEMSDSGIMIAKIQGAKVEIAIVAVTDKTVKVRVKARKAGMPKISVAQDVFVKIMSRMNEG
ncbi:MAG: hypothetical protein HQL25_04055 [Candidatus Omnitrophica bacterium]|nr:hypothetical protein [Candidatus Omnitrophota bacterium]